MKHKLYMYNKIMRQTEMAYNVLFLNEAQVIHE